jgi:CBS domain-containing protein
MKIRDIMTSPVITVTPETPVQEVARLMRSKQISGVPVVDAAGRLQGVITELHLIERNAPLKEPQYIAVLSGLIPIHLSEHRAYKEQLRQALATTAGELMDSTDIATLSPDDPVEQAMSIMSNPENTMLPIIEQGAVMGVVTRTDLVRLIEQLEGRLDDTAG